MNILHTPNTLRLGLSRNLCIVLAACWLILASIVYPVNAATAPSTSKLKLLDPMASSKNLGFGGIENELAVIRQEWLSTLDFGQATEQFKSIEETSLLANNGDRQAQFHLGLIKLLIGDIAGGLRYLTLATEQGEEHARKVLLILSAQEVANYVPRDTAISELKRLAEADDADSRALLGMCYEFGWGVTTDAKLALSSYLEAAEKFDHGASQLRLAIGFGSSFFGEKNLEKSHYWLSKAARNGEILAQRLLGLKNLRGDIDNYNPTEALRWLKLSASRGDLRSQILLGELLLDPTIGTPNYDESAKWFLLAANNGDPGSMIRVAILVDRGRTRLINDNNANELVKLGLKTLRSLSDAGDSESQYFLGQLNLFGVFVTRSIDNAIAYFQQAAESKNVRAMITLSMLYRDGFIVAKDCDKAAQLLLELSADEIPLVTARLGWLHAIGCGVPQDGLQALALLRKAYDKGYLPAIGDMAAMHYDGLGVTEDKKKAYELYLRGSRHNDAASVYMIGIYHETGTIVKQSSVRAREYYDLAVEHDFPLGFYAIGTQYYYGNGVERDIDVAKMWYEEGAKRNDILSIQTLSSIALAVQLPEREVDYAEALKWHRRGAKLGNPIAIRNLGAAYREGLAIDKDMKKAVHYYLLAANKGDAIAQKRVGEWYFFGNPLEKNIEESIRWHKLAASQNHAESHWRLAWLYRHGEFVSPNYDDALFHYQQAIEGGFTAAYYGLAQLYRNGQGVRKDLKKAYSLHRVAATKGYQHSYFMLGEMCYFGEGVLQSFDEALTWYRLGSAAGHAKSFFRIADIHLNQEISERNPSEGLLSLFFYLNHKDKYFGDEETAQKWVAQYREQFSQAELESAENYLRHSVSQ